MNEKMGGPYTREEQTVRRNQVFELHFEQGYSAVHIAKSLDVNRNTINKDIAYWYSELRSEKLSYNKNWLDKQLTKLEFQRTRIQSELAKNISLKERLQIEKIIANIDLKIAAFFVKLDTTRKHYRI